MSDLGALVVHGLFEHEGRHKDNVEWLKNLGIETYPLNQNKRQINELQLTEK